MRPVRTFFGNLRNRIFGSGRGRAFGRPGDRDQQLTGLTLDQKDLLSQYDHTELLNACRHIYNGSPLLQGAIDDKANASTGGGWGPQFAGTDMAWGEPAEDWLIEHFKICDLRGRPYDMAMNTHLGSVTLDRDGEYFIFFVKTAEGYPMFQFVESHRIGNRYHNTSYGTAQVRNGIAYNAFGRPIAYHYLGDTKDNDRWLPAKDVCHVYDPKWFSQGRGVSPIVFAILDWLDVQETRNNEKVAQRIFSALSLKVSNKTGKPDSFTQRFGKGATQTSPSGDESTSLVEEFKSGLIRYLKINDEQVEAFNSGNRPSADQRAFEESILRGAFAGIGWTYEQSVDASKLGGASIRRDIQKNQRSVERRQKVLLYPWTRITGYSIAVASNLGLIPANPQWWMFVPQLPAKMTADAGNESRIEQEEYKLGVLTMRAFASRRGDWWQDIRSQREIEVDDLLTRAENLQKKHTWLTREAAIQLIEMRTPNGNMQVDTDAKDDKTSTTRSE
jgi:hypothetical protein